MSTSRDVINAALNHQQPEKLPIDFGGTNTSGVHVSCVAALRDYYGLEKQPVKVYEPSQMLGWIDEDLKQAMGVDVEQMRPAKTAYGFANCDWKEWRMPDGLVVLVAGQFNTTTDDDNNIYMYPQGDLTAPPSAKMPNDGYFFDAIIRQQPIDDDNLNPEDNLEEYQPITDAALQELKQSAAEARASGRAVCASLGGTALGDIAHIPGTSLKHPKGIRDISEWYMSIATRSEYIHAMYEKQCEIALGNLEKIAKATGGDIDVVFVCGTDFGTQSGTFCSRKTFQTLWAPYYKEINNWIHENTQWKTFKHSCGAVVKFLDDFIECGFDIYNPVQCSAANMDAKELKQRFGDRIVFWGGGVDTQKTLPFGTPEEVRKEVLERCDIFAPGGGFVFNTVHNIQARTPVENVVAMLDALREWNG
ncbi:MAG: uroporphyrinogen decarboxylase family protein [Candidatus Hinthialibacter antarcticus]|nr:uroporphyrinogen decarboxylase family protein [Candidatus Hinthialibacter antarcticus]